MEQAIVTVENLTSVLHITSRAFRVAANQQNGGQSFLFYLLYNWQEISSKWLFKHSAPRWLIFLVYYYIHFQKMTEGDIQEMSFFFWQSEKHLGFYFWYKVAEIHIPMSIKHKRFRNHHLW